jgi:hypothetical protein
MIKCNANSAIAHAGGSLAILHVGILSSGIGYGSRLLKTGQGAHGTQVTYDPRDNHPETPQGPRIRLCLDLALQFSRPFFLQQDTLRFSCPFLFRMKFNRKEERRRSLRPWGWARTIKRPPRAKVNRGRHSMGCMHVVPGGASTAVGCFSSIEEGVAEWSWLTSIQTPARQLP